MYWNVRIGGKMTKLELLQLRLEAESKIFMLTKMLESFDKRGLPSTKELIKQLSNSKNIEQVTDELGIT